MTDHEWGAMTERARDALIAEVVFGAQLHELPNITYFTLPGEDMIRAQREVPPYTTNIAAAWQVVRRMLDSGWDWTSDTYRSGDGRFCVEFGRVAAGVVRHAFASTLPEAICKAALAACTVLDSLPSDPREPA